MANLIRWDPFREMGSMREVMDRLMEDGYTRPLGAGLWDVSPVPTMDLYQTEDSVVVKMGLPGVKPEDIQISVANGVLTIRGEVKEEKDENEKIYHLRERRFGSFSRSISLPSNVSADKSDAEFENGILTLTLPKAEEAKAKTIVVKAKK
ncbi:MAG: Hsp20/alpha crystallin family protein [Anaerolineales bacterium]|nr:Hsp20/alpha crystallin family protein [Anaerolineales bacterium]